MSDCAICQSSLVFFFSFINLPYQSELGNGFILIYDQVSFPVSLARAPSSINSRAVSSRRVPITFESVCILRQPVGPGLSSMFLNIALRSLSNLVARFNSQQYFANWPASVTALPIDVPRTPHQKESVIIPSFKKSHSYADPMLYPSPPILLNAAITTADCSLPVWGTISPSREMIWSQCAAMPSAVRSAAGSATPGVSVT